MTTRCIPSAFAAFVPGRTISTLAAVLLTFSTLTATAFATGGETGPSKTAASAPRLATTWYVNSALGANNPAPTNGTGTGAAAWQTIQYAISDPAVLAGDTIIVEAGNYNEDVNVNKSLTIQGAGAGLSIVSGVIGGLSTSTFALSASGIVLDGFTITRDGNNPAQWALALNTAGASIIGPSLTGIRISNCLFTGNRTGIDINNSSGHTVRNNVIDFNRTGMIMRNATDNLTVVENKITNNYTLGVIFLDASSGSNSPVQSALNCTFFNNDISGNWYAQIVDRQTGGSLPLPGANLKNLSGNWLGTTAPVVTVANSAEPSGNSPFPTAFGGPDSAPGGQPDIAGAASGNIDYTPYLNSGTDTDVSTGFGTSGFQGNFDNLWVDDSSVQTGSSGRIQEAMGLVVDTPTRGTIHVREGTYVESIALTKYIRLEGAGDGTNPLVDSVIAPAPGNPGINVQASGTALVPIEIVALNLTGGSHGINFSGTRSHVTIDNCTCRNSTGNGVEINGIVDDLDLLNVDLINNMAGAGFRVGTTGKLSNSSITNGNITGNDDGVLALSDLSATNNETGFVNVTVTGTTVSNNGNSPSEGKGLYFEKASGVALSGLTVNANGTGSNFPGGVLLNLKRGNFGSTSITNCVITNTAAGPGANGRAISVDVRNDGANGPTTFTAGNGVSVTGCTCTGSVTGILVGEEGALTGTCRVKIQGSNLSSNASVGLFVFGNALVDAGDCSNSNITGLGSSTGGNTFTGYGYPPNGTPPFNAAILGANAATGPDILAFNNNFGLNGVNNNFETYVIDGSDNPALGQVQGSQSTGLFITCPPAQSIQCNVLPAAATTLAQFLAAGGTSSATAGTVSSSDGALVGGLCGGTRTRTYTVSDTCGNSTTCTQVFTINDTTPPTLVTCGANPANVSVGANCLGVVPNVIGDVQATDNCAVGPTITQSPPAGSLLGLGTHTIVISISDSCNTITCNKSVTMVDTTPPSILCNVGSATVDLDSVCHALVPNFVPTVTASDTCSTPVVVTQNPPANDLLTGPTAPGSPILVQMKATDAAGNVAICTVALRVRDVTPPTITCNVASSKVFVGPACTATMPDLRGFVTANDNCNTVTPVLVSQAPAPGTALTTTQPMPNQLTVVFTATDGSNLTATCSMLFDLIDNTPPTVTAGTISSCYPTVAAAEAAAIAATTAVDNCDPSVAKTATTSGTCSATITVTGTDDTGNFATAVYSTRIDNTAPVAISTGPIGTCYPTVGAAQAAALMNSSATDNCMGPLAPSVSTSGTCSAVVTVTFADGCGNVSNVLTYNTRIDNASPTADQASGALDAALQCSDLAGISAALAQAPTFTDNCTAAPTVTMTGDNTVAGSCANAYTRTRTWTASDSCSNVSAVYTQTITVVDTTAPVATTTSGALDVTIQCSDAAGLSAALGMAPAFSDNCTAVPTLNGPTDSTTSNPPCPNAYTRTRTWTASDGCGNTSAIFTQTITVIDTVAPVVTTPTGSLDATLQCSDTAGIAAAVAAVPSASDNCTASPTLVPISDVTTGSMTCANAYVRVRTWNFTDGCSNTSANFVQTITVVDTTAPQATTAPGALDVTVQCNDVSGLNAALAMTPVFTDNCTASPTVSMQTDVTTPGSCANAYTRTRTWTASDGCSNTSAVFTQVITVVDTTAPVVTTVAGSLDATVQCSDAPGLAAALALAPSATDNCTVGLVPNLVSDNTVATPGCANTYVRTRVWNFNDGCTNVSASFTQLITVIDTQGPTWATFPADQTLACNLPRDPWATGTPTATDTCGAVTISYNDDRSTLNLCNSTGFITRTWTATDGCGNTTNQNQIINVFDSIAPVLVTPCPANIPVPADLNSCAAVVNFTPPTAVDVCYDQGFEDAGFLADPLGRSTDWSYDNSAVLRALSGTDGITSATGSAHAVLDSTAPPSFTGAFSRLGGYNPTFGTGFKTSVDIYLDMANPAVSAPSPTYGWDVSSAVSNQANGHRRDFIFHAASYTSGTITIGASNNSNFTRRNDLLSINHITLNTSGWYTFEWNYRNQAGQLAVDMTVRPLAGTVVFTEVRTDPSDLIATIVGGSRYMWFTFLEVDKLAIDNTRLERNVAMTCSASSGSSFPVGTTPVTCNGVDACGNPVSCGFSVTVTDTQLPSITCPGTIQVECSSPIPPPAADLLAFQGLGGSASDNCLGVNVTWVSDVGSPPGSGCGNYDIIRTYIATDAANNTQPCTQTIEVRDTTPPSITTSAGALDGTFQCSNLAGINLALALAPAATDNCTPSLTPIPVSDNTTVNPSCANAYVRVRTWKFTDLCNNDSGVFTQTITVVDTTAPVATTAAGALDVTIQCNDGPGLSAAIGMAPVFSDNCTAVPTLSPPTNSVTFSPSCPNAYTQTRTWTASDGCGNTSAIFTQTITVIDTIAPVVTTVAGSLDATLQCSDTAGIAAAAAALPSATDNCTASPTRVLVSDLTTGSMTCANAYVRVRTWNFTDGCSNTSANFVQTITVVDTTAPQATTAPGALDVTLQCSDASGLAAALTMAPVFTDNCTMSPVLSLPTDVTTQNPPCPNAYTRTRAWTASDGCGNTSAVFTQVITVIDTVAPVASGSPIAAWYPSQAAAGSAAEAATSATDNCTATPTRNISFSGSGCSLTITVTFTDGCSNTSNAIVYNTVIDGTDPVISGCPANQVYNAAPGECSHVFTWTPPTATDNCSLATFTSNHAPGEVFLPGTTTVTYTATDACGHVSICSFTLTINGDFGHVECYPTGTAPAEVAVAELGVAGNTTATGLPAGKDIVTADSGSDSLTVRFNDGTGNFSASSTTILLSNGDTPVAVVVGSFTASSMGKDLAVACKGRVSPPVPSSVKFLRNTGAGWVFDHAVTLGAHTNPIQIAAGDLDQIPASFDDLAVVCQGTLFTPGTAGMGVILNSAAYTILDTSTGGYTPQDVAIGDLNGIQDGVMDVVAVEEGGAIVSPNRVSLYMGIGGGSFLPRAFMNTSAEPYAVCAADMDGDGLTNDLVFGTDGTVIGGQGRVEVRKNLKSGAGLSAATFAAASNTTFIGPASGPADDGFNPRDLACGDLQRDTLRRLPPGSPAYFASQDVVTANFSGVGGSVSIGDSYNTTTNAFRSQTSICNIVGIASAVALADVDGDTLEDIIVTDQATNGNKVCVIYSRVRALATPFGAGCPGTAGLTPLLQGNNLAVMGQVATVDLSLARPNTAVVLGVSAAIQETQLLPSACVVYLANPIFTFSGLITNGAGNMTFAFAVPNVPSPFLGAEVYFQAAVSDPFGSYLSTLAFSNALRVRLGF